jgi:serine/threonine-protein kinase ATR
MIPFIDNRLPTDISTSNRVSLVEFLRELSNRNNLSEQETLIFAWGLVGRHCGEKELNLVLLQLVEYLGHPQALICGVAAGEIASLAEDFNKSVGELFRPFWRSVAASVVKDIFSCPQKAQQLSDLLSMSVNDLLLLTQAETVPYLTLTKKKDALDRIAAARGADTPVHDLWLQPTRNVATVAASLLLQHHSEGLKTITSLLHELDPDFTAADCQKLIIAEPIHTACEILKANGDSSEIQKVQASTQSPVY